MSITGMHCNRFAGLCQLLFWPPGYIRKSRRISGSAGVHVMGTPISFVANIVKMVHAMRASARLSLADSDEAMLPVRLPLLYSRSSTGFCCVDLGIPVENPVLQPHSVRIAAVEVEEFVHGACLPNGKVPISPGELLGFGAVEW